MRTLTWIDTSKLEPVGRSYTVRAVSGYRAAALARYQAHRDAVANWQTAPILYISEPDLGSRQDDAGSGSTVTFEYEVVIQTGWTQRVS